MPQDWLAQKKTTVGVSKPATIFQVERQARVPKAPQKTEVGEQSPEDIEIYNARIKAERDKFEQENVKLSTGEWVARSEYNKLNYDDQSRLKNLGTQGFNDYYKQKEIEYRANKIELPNGDWVDKKSYDGLPEYWKKQLNDKGIEGYNSWVKTAYGGAKEFFVIPDFYGKETIFGKTDNPNIGIDESGLRIWLGDRWPEEVRQYSGLTGEPVPSLQPPPESPIKLIEGINVWTDMRWPESALPGRLQTIATLEMEGSQPIKITAEDIDKGRWIKTQTDEYVSKKEYDNLPTEKLKQVLIKEGSAGLNKVIQLQEQEFRKSNIQLPTGEWVNKDEFNNLPAQIQDILRKGGIPQLNEYIKNQENILESLDKYKVADGYDIARYLRENEDPQSVSRLLKVGFDPESIRENINYNSLPYVRKSNIEDILNEIVKTSGDKIHIDDLLHPDYDFNRTLDQLKKDHPKLAEKFIEARSKWLNEIKTQDVEPPISLDQFIASYALLKGIEPTSLIDFAVLFDKEKQNIRAIAIAKYQELYGEKQSHISGVESIISTLFTPARALYPEVTLGDIRPLEWAIGAAQIATCFVAPAISAGLKTAAPLAGKVMPNVINLVAGGIFTTSTLENIKENPRMNIIELSLDIALDTLVIASALNGLKGTKFTKPQKASIKASINQSINTASKITGSSEIQQALKKISAGIQKDNTLLLNQGSEQLRLVGAKTPKELGGNRITDRARLLRTGSSTGKKIVGIENIDDLIKRNDDLIKRIEVNQQHLNIAEEHIKKVTNPKTREAIEKNIEETQTQLQRDVKQLKQKKQVQVVEREPKTYPLWERMLKEEEARKAGRLAIVSKDNAKIVAQGKTTVKEKLAVKEKVTENTKTKTEPKAKQKVKRKVEVKERVRVSGSIAPTVDFEVAPTNVIWAVSTQPISNASPLITTRTTEVVQPITETTTQLYPQTVTKTAVRVGTKVQTALQLQTKPKLETLTKQQVRTKVVPKIVTRTKTKVVPKFLHPSKTKTKEPAKRIIPKITPWEQEGIKFSDLTRSQRLASVAWRQGAVYHLIYPPYNENAVLHSSKPFPGIKLHKGPLSAYKSLSRIKGNQLPDKILWDLGIMDIEFTRGKKGSVGMRYIPDVKQQTTVRRAVGMPQIQVSTIRR